MNLMKMKDIVRRRSKSFNKYSMMMDQFPSSSLTLSSLCIYVVLQVRGT